MQRIRFLTALAEDRGLAIHVRSLQVTYQGATVGIHKLPRRWITPHSWRRSGRSDPRRAPGTCVGGRRLAKWGRSSRKSRRMSNDMNEDRRYQNQEIREILELAGRDDLAQPKSAPTADGLTASELQAVGREVGLAPERIAQAVAEFEGRGELVPRISTLGMPTSTGRTVSLTRAPTDSEWELLVSELRTTFGAKGEMSSAGGLREWSNGSLHAFIEPTSTGYRLRLADSMEGAAVVATIVGGFFLAFALLILLVLLGKTDPGARFVVPAFFSVIGTGLIGGAKITLPRWADEREAQMKHITSRAKALIDSPMSHDFENDVIQGERLDDSNTRDAFQTRDFT